MSNLETILIPLKILQAGTHQNNQDDVRIMHHKHFKDLWLFKKYCEYLEIWTDKDTDGIVVLHTNELCDTDLSVYVNVIISFKDLFN